MDYNKKKEELEKKFSELEKKRIEMSNQVQEIAKEQIRLQGEFRLIDELSKETKEEEEKKGDD